MASLADTLTASGGTESAGFLNDIIAQLWPNINVAGGKIIKQVVEPMLDSMLPGPLSTLRFARLDFGPTPIRLSHVDVHKTELQGIKLDMDLEWGGTQELSLVHKGQPTESKLTVHAKFYNFIGDSNSISAAGSQSEGQICGLASVLIAGVAGLTGQRDKLNPSVKVSWGDKEFVTPGKTYSPGTDIFNPAFDTAFRFPITADMIADPPNFQLTLMNGTEKSGSYEIPFASVAGASGMNLAEEFDVGSGAAIRAQVSLRGLQLAK